MQFFFKSIEKLPLYLEITIYNFLNSIQNIDSILKKLKPQLSGSYICIETSFKNSINLRIIKKDYILVEKVS